MSYTDTAHHERGISWGEAVTHFLGIEKLV